MTPGTVGFLEPGDCFVAKNAPRSDTINGVSFKKEQRWGLWKNSLGFLNDPSVVGAIIPEDFFELKADGKRAMIVTFYATLRQVVGTKTVEVPYIEGMTVRKLVNEVIEGYPALRSELLDEQGELYGHVHVFVNGRDAPYLENALDALLSAEDKVSIFPAVGGG